MPRAAAESAPFALLIQLGITCSGNSAPAPAKWECRAAERMCIQSTCIATSVSCCRLERCLMPQAAAGGHAETVSVNQPSSRRAHLEGQDG